MINGIVAGTPVVITTSSVVANGLVGIVPAGYMLETVVAQETGGANVDIKLGTAAGLDNIAFSQTMAASVCTTIFLDRAPQATPYNVFVSSAAWTTASLNIYLFNI